MNPEPTVDLHCHSRASDGLLRPAELVRLAHDRGLGAIALTDHDTLAGAAEAAAEARRLGVEFLTGVEISCAFPRPGTLHLLGYGVDPDDPTLWELLQELEAARGERIRVMLERLGKLGVDLTWDEVMAEAGTGGSVGRPHLAAAMKRRGYVLTTREAFGRYLGGAGAAYADTNPVAPERAIAVVRAAGGLASLAHPMQLRRQTSAQLEAMVRELAEQGMEGLETIHGSHSAEDVHRLTRLADRLDLLPTGGSDFHGEGKSGAPLGNPSHPVPAGCYRDLLERLGGVDRDGRARRRRRHTRRTEPGTLKSPARDFRSDASAFPAPGAGSPRARVQS